jgi:hypothetical protein
MAWSTPRHRDQRLIVQGDARFQDAAMSPAIGRRPGRLTPSLASALVINALFAVLGGPAVRADHGQPHVVEQSSTGGCQGVKTTSGGNTQMRLVGGTLVPGGTAIFEITYPLDPSNVGKEFQIRDCAYVNDIAVRHYLIDFVPSNANYVLTLSLGIPSDAPVGGEYCNYAKTTRSPTAAQGSIRKAGPTCFIIRAPTGQSGPAPSRPPAPSASGAPGTPIFLPNTSTAGEH